MVLVYQPVLGTFYVISHLTPILMICSGETGPQASFLSHLTWRGGEGRREEPIQILPLAQVATSQLMSGKARHIEESQMQVAWKS